MSAFTFTAPLITEDQERAERESVTKLERDRLNAEIYGSAVPDAIEETPELVERSVRLLKEELDLIEDKDEYLEAVQRVPDLVARESPEISFLRCERWNVRASAQRLVQYWKLRKLVFGQDRMHLPMTISGAMADDVEYLEKAIIYEIEPYDHGRPVIFGDRIRAEPAIAPRDAVVRCTFYNLQKLSQRPEAQKSGFVFLLNMRGYDMYKHYDRILTKRVFASFRTIPINLLASHMCSGSGRSVLDIVMPILKQMAGKDIRLRSFLHAGTGVDILHKFREFGLNQLHIDVIFEGQTIRNSMAAKWVQLARQTEGEVHIPFSQEGNQNNTTREGTVVK